MQITINDVNNLTNTERDILRVVLQASVAEGLKDAVRVLHDPHCAGCDFEEGGGPCSAQVCVRPQPIEPTEALSPHVQVVELPENTAFATGDKNPLGLTDTDHRVQLDSRGLPWDRRIHASTKAINSDGTWRNMRGVDKDLLASVEQELRDVQALPVPTPETPPTWPFATVGGVVSLDGAGGADMSSAQAVVDMPTAPAAPVPPVPAPPAYANAATHNGVLTITPVATPPVTGAVPTTFIQLMSQHITPRLVDGTLTQERLQQIVQSIGLPHLAALGPRPDLIPAVYAEVPRD